MDERSFERRVIEQRRAMRASPEELLERVERSPYGPKSKEILREMVAHESTGQVGFALFDCPPAIVRGAGARVWDADDKEYVDMLAGFSVAVFGLLVNWVAGALLAFTIFFYVFVYTMWLKRSTPQNIVVGGAAGAFPPMIG